MTNAIDLTGRRFGRLTVIELAGRMENRRRAIRGWRCRCDCGNEIIADTSSLRRGNTTGCPHCWQVKDEIGNRYGHVIVISRAEKANGQGAMWLCRCDCGTEFVTRGSSLRKGSTKSCGCVRTEKLRDAVILPNGVSARNQALRAVKRSATDRSIEWCLTDEQALQLMNQPCHYCGTTTSNLSRHPEFNGDFRYNGIDRVDNSVGYVIGNVVTCCKHCNIAKRDRTTTEFLRWIELVYKHSVLSFNQGD